MRYETLGNLIEAYRKIRRVSVETLVSELHISTSTFYRIVHDEADLTVPQFWQSVDLLMISPSDVVTTLRSSLMPLNAETIAFSAQPDADLEAIERLMRQFANTKNIGYQLLADARRAMIGAPRFPKQASPNIRQLMQTLVALPYWSCFEWGILAKLAPYCSYAELNDLIRNAPQTDLNFNVRYQAHDFSDLAAAVLQSAVLTQGPAEILCAATWISTQDTLNPDYLVRLWQVVAHAIVVRLTQGRDQGRLAFARIQDAMAYFHAEKFATELKLGELWHKIDLVAGNQRLAPIELAIKAMPAPSSGTTSGPGAQIDRLRRLREFSVREFCRLAHLSTAMYYRLIHDDETVKVSVLFTALEYLRVDPYEFFSTFDNGYRRLRGLWERVRSWLSQLPHTSAEVTQEAAYWRAESRRTGSGYYDRVAVWIEVQQAMAAGHVKQVTRAAQTELSYWSQFSDWTDLDQAFMLNIMAIMPLEFSQPFVTSLLHRAVAELETPYSPSEIPLVRVIQQLLMVFNQVDNMTYRQMIVTGMDQVYALADFDSTIELRAFDFSSWLTPSATVAKQEAAEYLRQLNVLVPQDTQLDSWLIWFKAANT